MLSEEPAKPSNRSGLESLIVLALYEETEAQRVL
jgi:hypothetical protein